jgi:hypothetical protein
MPKKINGFVYWAPRILSIVFIAFLALMSLDIFAPGLSFGQIMLGLLMHNIPVFILLIVLLISWKHEIVGGVVFILAGILYIILLMQSSFEWYKLAWLMQISGVAWLVGVLFLVGWVKKRKKIKT